MATGGFNRTIVGLKYDYPVVRKRGFSSFNRTIVGLKAVAVVAAVAVTPIALAKLPHDHFSCSKISILEYTCREVSTSTEQIEAFSQRLSNNCKFSALFACFARCHGFFGDPR